MKYIWYAILASIVLTPTYLLRFTIAHKLPTTAFEIIILVLVFATLVNACASAHARAQYRAKLLVIQWPLVAATFLFVVAGCISVWVSPDMRAALGIWKAYIFEAILYGLIIFLHLEHEEQLRDIAVAFSITAFVVALYAVVQKFTGWGIPNPFWRAEATRRVTSFFGYPNGVGLYLELAVPFVVALFFLTKNICLRAWCIVVVIVSCLAILFAQSSGTVAALGGTAILFLLAIRKTRKIAAIVVVAGIIILALSPLRKPFADEFLLQGFSGRLRTQMWRETVVMLRERPVVGAGLAGYQARVKPFHVFKWAEIYLYPHNLFLTLWSELGAIGVISFAWIFILLVRWSLRHENRIWNSVILATCSIIFIHGLVDIPYFKNDLSALFWLVVAIAVFMRYNRLTASKKS